MMASRVEFGATGKVVLAVIESALFRTVLADGVVAKLGATVAFADTGMNTALTVAIKVTRVLIMRRFTATPFVMANISP